MCSKPNVFAEWQKHTRGYEQISLFIPNLATLK